MLVKIKVSKYIGLFLFAIPIMLIIAFGMFFARTDDGGIFFPFLLGSFGFFTLAFFAIKYLFEMIKETKEYHFDIQEDFIDIKKFVNNILRTSYHIKKDELKSFNNTYKNTYGAVTSTYVFEKINGNKITIVEDFGLGEKDIINTLFKFSYYSNSVKSQLKENVK
jgi:hypothetical protein